MYIYFIALLVPSLGAFLMKVFFHDKICFKEFLTQLCIQTLLIVCAIALVMNQAVSDVEVWNSQVSDKRHYSTQESRSYSCRCKPKKGCDTCYERWTEYHWKIDVADGSSMCVRCGSRFPFPTPDLYQTIQIGDPVASTHSYSNPIKAAPGTLFRNQGSLNAQWEIPQYPSNVYDLIKIDRVVSVNGATIGEGWQQKVAELNKRVGPIKQTNMVFVLVKDYPSTYYHSLRQAWLGAKKNDVVTVIGVDGNGVINWVEVMAWSKNSMIEVTLRDDIKDLGMVDFDKVVEKAELRVMKDYERKPMADFEYLYAQATPTTGQWIFFMIFSIVVWAGLSIFFYTNEVFPDRSNRFNKRRF